MTIVEKTRPVVGGVDTHADVHVAAVVDHLGGVLDIAAFDTTEAGYQQLVRWLRSHGTVRLVGVEGTGSYGAGLARHLTRAGSSSSRLIDRTAKRAIATASPIRSTPSPQLEQHCRVSLWGGRSRATATSRRSGC